MSEAHVPALQELKNWCVKHKAVITEDGGKVLVVIGNDTYETTMLHGKGGDIWQVIRHRVVGVQ